MVLKDSEHQLWAKTHLELRDLEPDDEALLKAALSAHSEDASPYQGPRFVGLAPVFRRGAGADAFVLSPNPRDNLSQEPKALRRAVTLA